MFIPVARRYRLDGCMPTTAGSMVLRRDMLGAIRSASELLSVAQTEYQRTLDAARMEAAEIIESAKQEALTVALDAQKAVWESALALLDEIQRQRTAMLAEAETMLEQIARAGLQRLLLDVPADWPPASSIRLVLLEWQRGHDTSDAVLRVNPQDFESLPGELCAGVRWKCVPDAFVEPGGCILSLGGTDIGASYSASVRSLVASMGHEVSGAQNSAAHLDAGTPLFS